MSVPTFNLGERVAWVDEGGTHEGNVAAYYPNDANRIIVHPDLDHPERGYWVVDLEETQVRRVSDPPPADPFDAVVSEITEMNRRKRGDYASDSDIFSNFKDAGRQLGLTAGHAVELHIATKQSRLRQLLGSGREPNNESVRDSLLDRAVYSIIALALYDAGLYQPEE